MTGNSVDRISEDAVRFMLRGDLVFQDYPVGIDNRTVVKDPLKLEYYLFDPFEKTILTMLSQPLSLTELKARVDQFSTDTVDISAIRRFLQRLLKDNLIVADRPGFGHALWNWHKHANRQQWMQRLFSILAIRLPGLNPQPLLDRLNPFTKYLFQPICLSLATLAFLISMIAVALNTDQLMQMSELWRHLSHPRMMIALLIGTMIVKSLHELGHALACSSIGRDCHEMGVMFLVFMPCLYCNVSDIWMESDRWKRMLVSAAGIYVEMLFAVLCVPIWLLSQNGALQVFSFAMLGICSVNTLFVNGNPLLRYDGYYVLSDWLEIPNLSSRGQQLLANRIRWIFQTTNEPPPAIGFVDVYGLASKLYRLLILGLILGAVYSVFSRFDLPQLGLIVSLLLFCLTFGPGLAITAVKVWRGSRDGIWRTGRVVAFAIGLLLLVTLLLNLPVRPRYFADGEIALRAQGTIYAPFDGRIQWLARGGDQVNVDQVIARIENAPLQLELVRQQQGIRELELSLANQSLLQRQRADNSREIELQKDMLDSARKIEAELIDRIEKLQIHATASGKLVALPGPLDDGAASLDLTRRSSSLLNRNHGCSIDRGEPIALITSPQTMIVRLWVQERNINHVMPGQPVKMLIRQTSPDFVWGKVVQIAIDKTERPIQPEMENMDRQTPTVAVLVQLDRPDANHFFKSHVHAAIVGQSIPLYEYFWRLISENLGV